ncbi:MAG: DUF554 domain-containing protein [Pedosphaera sp.]|nr:DUF554 domain-containing protein [Pedosphaera sp.]MSS99748.1 DUF554 domain-containing protein [Pedosphaera sp.]
MTGTIINAAAVLVGGAIGLAANRRVSLANQRRIKLLLALLTVVAGGIMIWDGLKGGFTHGGFIHVTKLLVVVLAALMLGSLTGYFLGVQRRLNKLGQYAKERFSKAQTAGTANASEGFVTCTLLFCVTPMAILGSIEDGLTGSFKILALKAAMDGLSTIAFAATFGWSVLLSLVPLVAYQGTLTLLARYLQPVMEQRALLDSINLAGGFLVLCIVLILLEVKKVELANYLPALIYAPLLMWLLG